MNFSHKMLITACCGACFLSGALGADGGAAAALPPGAASGTVALWSEVAAATINLPPDAAGTPEEQRPIYGNDLATVHVAIYDAVMAIAGTHRPFAVTPTAAAAGASPDAAAGEAAYRVLRGLFPSRSARYQPAYEGFMASLADGPAKTRGLAVGAEVAAAVLTMRAADGRSAVLAPYVPGSAAGQFRGANPINRMLPGTKPFTLTSTAQFRAPGPPVLASAAYAADFNETRLLGGAASTSRTPAQAEVARFESEAPFTFWPRNLRRLADDKLGLAAQARLMAMVWVTHADATNACFESKYHFQFWRPLSAIPLAPAGGSERNEATAPDPAWVPFLPTPPHPEYPAGHSCVTSALAETLRGFFGTPDVAFDFDSTVTGSTRHYTAVQALIDDVQIARIAGGMHFRSATVDGAALGQNVARWALAHNFQPR